MSRRIVESAKIAAKGVETIGQDAAEYSRKSFEGATAALKSLVGRQVADRLLQAAERLSPAARSTALVAETSKNTEAMLKLAGEVAQPISNRVAVAAEKVKILRRKHHAASSRITEGRSSRGAAALFVWA